MAAQIISVQRGSLAESSGIKTGDVLVSINGKKLKDVLDYQYLCQDEHLDLKVKRDGEFYSTSIDNDADRGLGLKFSSSVFDKIMTCNNSCQFCFIDQLPRGLRPSLYLKDDDYRLSFLYGNFITLTNMGDGDIKRIIDQRLSPIYVSLHSSDILTRKELIRPKDDDIVLEMLNNLIAGGIEAHIQIVLCPGINDGPPLTKTILELQKMGVASIGIVPAGLTGYRDKLETIRPVSGDEAKELIRAVSKTQDANMKSIGRRVVFLADEFYLISGTKLPDGEYYEDYPQLENGIGLSRLFLDEIETKMNDEDLIIGKKEHAVLTSTMAAPVLTAAIESINRRTGAMLRIVEIKNSFFAGHISVAGLLAGADIKANENLFEQGESVLAPDISLNQDRLFLDGISEEEIKGDVFFDLQFVSTTGSAFIDFLMEKAG